MDTVLTLSAIHPRDRLAFWYDVACKVFVDHECHVKTPSRFDVTMQHAALGNLGIVEIDSTGLHSAAVTSRTISNAEEDVFFLCLQLKGTATFDQDGRETTILPGDFALLDAQRPYCCHYPSDWKQIIIKIPHRALKARLAASSELTACAVHSSDRIGGLASGYMSLIPPRIDGMNPAVKPQIAEHVLDLIVLSLSDMAGKEVAALSSRRALALLRLRTAIENHLADPRLDPSIVAAAAGMSIRYANALLSQQGTSVERLIVLRRLEHCRRALEDPGQSHRTITEIAFAWGFSDQSHFNRRFKAEYGCSPREYRQRLQS
jgi:AraC family transcriptional regulator, positive regulator of tynA and feaB